MKNSKAKMQGNKFGIIDAIILMLLVLGALLIIIPFINVVAVSFTSYKETIESSFVFWPKNPTLAAYKEMIKDNRILIGYKTTLIYVLIGVPLNLFLCTSLAYAFSRKGWPGRKMVFTMVLFTMVFGGGIVPTYLVMKKLHLAGTIWAVILPSGMNTFNMILIYNYICSVPESLVESASLDGANEWTILAKIVVPLLKPILATVVLFSAVAYWNEYFMSMIFLRSNNWQSLQQVLRSIVMDSQVSNSVAAMANIEDRNNSEAIKMACVLVTMVIKENVK